MHESSGPDIQTRFFFVRPCPSPTVQGGEKAIVFNRIGGLSDKVVGEGTHLVVPWLQIPIIFNVRSRYEEFSSPTGSRGESADGPQNLLALRYHSASHPHISSFLVSADLQTVQIKLRMLFKPDASRLPHIYSTIGQQYDKKVLPSIANEVLKSTVASGSRLSLMSFDPLPHRGPPQRPHSTALPRHVGPIQRL